MRTLHIAWMQGNIFMTFMIILVRFLRMIVYDNYAHGPFEWAKDSQYGTSHGESSSKRDC